jgi:hypothetical protein
LCIKAAKSGIRRKTRAFAHPSSKAKCSHDVLLWRSQQDDQDDSCLLSPRSFSEKGLISSGIFYLTLPDGDLSLDPM